MGFTIATDLGMVTPRGYGEHDGVPVLAVCPHPLDNINGENFTNDWSKTADIASVATKNGIYSFRQGVCYGYRQVAEFNNGTLVSQYQSNRYYDADYIGFCAMYTTAEETSAVLFFVWIKADTEERAIEALQYFTGTPDNYHYGFTIGTFTEGDFPNQWDETPSEDPEDFKNVLPNGGEYADLGYFDDTDDMLEADMPDPDDLEMDYSGLITCYSLFESGLQEFGRALFETNFWTSLMNKFNGLSDPLSMILDCTEIPIGALQGDGTVLCELGGIEVPAPEGGTYFIRTRGRRYHKASCGSITLKEVWGSAKDYTDCNISIFLPYCGVKELDPDIVLRCTLTLYVYIDLWNGDLLYLLHASNSDTQKKYFKQENVIYRWTGNCGKKIPLGRVDTSGQILQVASGLATVGLGLAAGGAMGGLAFGGGATMGNSILGATLYDGGRRTLDAMTNGFRPTVQSSGGVGGSVGRMDYQYPYLIIKRGVPEYPNNWRAEIGAPRNQTFQLSDLRDTGYTLFSHIQLGNMGNATEEEKSELERLLTTEGIIL